MRNIFVLFLLATIVWNAYADEQIARSIATSPHIKLMNYSKNNIHKYVGFYGYQSSIIFAADEVIDTISMGVSTGWQLEPKGNRLFIKPSTEGYTDTNATIITNKRVYHFKLYAKEAEGLDDPEIAYEVRLQYPNDDIVNSDTRIISEITKGNPEIPDISSATNINFNYTVSGSDYIKPIKVFDYQGFTYLEFKDTNADLPAIFLVDSEGYESLINFRVRGNYIIIERVAAKFTLRNGSDIACLTNHEIPYHYKKPKKKGIFGY